MAHYDAIVVGAGVVGSAATAHLTRDGYDMLTLERYGVPKSLSTAHGGSRIFRLAYNTGSQYVPMLRRAHSTEPLKTRSSSLI